MAFRRLKTADSSTAGGHCAGSDNLLRGEYGKNPYQLVGPKEGFEAKAVKEGLYVRVDMPGVEKDDVEVWMKDQIVYFIGKDSYPYPNWVTGRSYGGSIDLSYDSGDVVEIKSEVKNGVLRMILVGCHVCPNIPARANACSFSTNDVNFEERIGDCVILYRTFPLLTPPDKYCGLYPCQVGGNMGAYEVIVLENENLLMRVDMPDVSKEKRCLKLLNNIVMFGGDGLKESEHDEGRRSYFGKFSLNCGCCKIADLKGQINAGVLWMMISKEKLELK